MQRDDALHLLRERREQLHALGVGQLFLYGSVAPQLHTRKNINLSTGRLNERNLQIASVVKAVAQEMDRTTAQVALAWTLRHPAVVSPIIGARTLPQLKENLACLQITFSDEQVARLDALSRIELGFPHTLLTSQAMPSMFGHVKVEARRELGITGEQHV